jgi:hypothetical protein
MKVREILRLYRPGTMDAMDPQMAEALQEVQRDPELAHWFNEQCGVYIAIRSKLKQIEVPADLKRRILLENVGRRKMIHLNRPVTWLAAAAAVALLGVVWWTSINNSHGRDFMAYRDRMTGAALRGYAMSLTSTNLATIQQFLRGKGQADYALTKGLEKLPAEGCATPLWYKVRSSMICFDAGKTKDGKQKEVYLFVANRSELDNAPGSSKPKIEEVRNTMTASWTAGDRVYVLVASRNERELEPYLN